MQISFRQASVEDLNPVMNIINAAKETLRKAGIDQWQNGYPSLAGITRDIKNKCSYVLEENKEIVATVAFYFGAEPDYFEITEGAWLSNQPYATIHRVAVKQNQQKGLADELYKNLEALCLQKNVYSIRADTHAENISMQSFILRQGFNRCGIIHLTGNAENRAARVAFEKLLPR